MCVHIIRVSFDTEYDTRSGKRYEFSRRVVGVGWGGTVQNIERKRYVIVKPIARRRSSSSRRRFSRTRECCVRNVECDIALIVVHVVPSTRHPTRLVGTRLGWTDETRKNVSFSRCFWFQNGVELHERVGCGID